MKTILFLASAALLSTVATGCIEHRVKADPIEIKPIHITVDVNVKVDRELDDFFAFEEDYRKTEFDQ